MTVGNWRSALWATIRWVTASLLLISVGVIAALGERWAAEYSELRYLQNGDTRNLALGAVVSVAIALLSVPRRHAPTAPRLVKAARLQRRWDAADIDVSETPMGSAWTAVATSTSPHIVHTSAESAAILRGSVLRYASSHGEPVLETTWRPGATPELILEDARSGFAPLIGGGDLPPDWDVGLRSWYLFQPRFGDAIGEADSERLRRMQVESPNRRYYLIQLSIPSNVPADALSEGSTRRAEGAIYGTQAFARLASRGSLRPGTLSAVVNAPPGERFYLTDLAFSGLGRRFPYISTTASMVFRLAAPMLLALALAAVVSVAVNAQWLEWREEAAAFVAVLVVAWAFVVYATARLVWPSESLRGVPWRALVESLVVFLLVSDFDFDAIRVAASPELTSASLVDLSQQVRHLSAGMLVAFAYALAVTGAWRRLLEVRMTRSLLSTLCVVMAVACVTDLGVAAVLAAAALVSIEALPVGQRARALLSLSVVLILIEVATWLAIRSVEVQGVGSVAMALVSAPSVAVLWMGYCVPGPRGGDRRGYLVLAGLVSLAVAAGVWRIASAEAVAQTARSAELAAEPWLLAGATGLAALMSQLFAWWAAPRADRAFVSLTASLVVLVWFGHWGRSPILALAVCWLFVVTATLLTRQEGIRGGQLLALALGAFLALLAGSFALAVQLFYAFNKLIEFVPYPDGVTTLADVDEYLGGVALPGPYGVRSAAWVVVAGILAVYSSRLAKRVGSDALATVPGRTRRAATPSKNSRIYAATLLLIKLVSVGVLIDLLSDPYGGRISSTMTDPIALAVVAVLGAATLLVIRQVGYFSPGAGSALWVLGLYMLVNGYGVSFSAGVILALAALGGPRAALGSRKASGARGLVSIGAALAALISLIELTEWISFSYGSLQDQFIAFLRISVIFAVFAILAYQLRPKIEAPLSARVIALKRRSRFAVGVAAILGLVAGASLLASTAVSVDEDLPTALYVVAMTISVAIPVGGAWLWVNLGVNASGAAVSTALRFDSGSFGDGMQGMRVMEEFGYLRFSNHITPFFERSDFRQRVVNPPD